jgi:hypothetical protein
LEVYPPSSKGRVEIEIKKGDKMSKKKIFATICILILSLTYIGGLNLVFAYGHAGGNGNPAWHSDCCYSICNHLYANYFQSEDCWVTTGILAQYNIDNTPWDEITGPTPDGVGYNSAHWNFTASTCGVYYHSGWMDCNLISDYIWDHWWPYTDDPWNGEFLGVQGYHKTFDWHAWPEDLEWDLQSIDSYVAQMFLFEGEWNDWVYLEAYTESGYVHAHYP